jgi:hypothetical protein
MNDDLVEKVVLSLMKMARKKFIGCVQIVNSSSLNFLKLLAADR